MRRISFTTWFSNGFCLTISSQSSRRIYRSGYTRITEILIIHVASLKRSDSYILRRFVMSLYVKCHPYHSFITNRTVHYGVGACWPWLYFMRWKQWRKSHLTLVVSYRNCFTQFLSQEVHLQLSYLKVSSVIIIYDDDVFESLNVCRFALLSINISHWFWRHTISPMA